MNHQQIKTASQDHIIIRGLCQNNLKNVSLDIPKGKIVVFTGVSGSGHYGLRMLRGQAVQ